MTTLPSIYVPHSVYFVTVLCDVIYVADRIATVQIQFCELLIVNMWNASVIVRSARCVQADVTASHIFVRDATTCILHWLNKPYGHLVRVNLSVLHRDCRRACNCLPCVCVCIYIYTHTHVQMSQYLPVIPLYLAVRLLEVLLYRILKRMP